MKIFYGVQATGNGHISRARSMDEALKQKDIHIDYLFSGRDRDQFFAMEQFGDFECRSGLTFVTESGKVKPIKTMQKNNILQLFKDIKQLNLSDYDLVITDFEPITAWAAKKQKVPSIAIGHQYAFHHGIPKKGNNFFTQNFMKYFAPADTEFGLHWHHFNQPILPPIIDLDENTAAVEENKIIVYLGFENQEEVINLLSPIKTHNFYIYGHFDKKEDRDNIKLRPVDRKGFKYDLSTSNGVITNAGFELASEAISLGKKILVKPLMGQMEQLSNALALEKLDLGMAMQTLDKNIIEHWLKDFQGKTVNYPSVPNALADFISQGNWADTKSISQKLWQDTYSTDSKHFHS